MKLIPAIDEFLTHLRLERDASPKTTEQYAFHLFRLACHMMPGLAEEKVDDNRASSKTLYLDTSIDRRELRERQRILSLRHPAMIEDLSREDIRDFRIALHDQHLSITTVNAHIISIRSFLKYLKKA
ncbi:MAG TPA: site-specific integrase [bacterium]|nr:site-specific integrase [bacterium]